ncbi:hypothetical protein D5086_020219 [Populus alba]|uniref:Uncharacterized protein n=1 Tax=Populus alba TaxID=43335 RepID=A0ACC4BJI1_POPAL
MALFVQVPAIQTTFRPNKNMRRSSLTKKCTTLEELPLVGLLLRIVEAFLMEAMHSDRSSTDCKPASVVHQK